MRRFLVGLLLALTLSLGSALAPAAAGAWLGGYFHTGCGNGTTQLNLYVNGAPINGAMVYFSNGSSNYFPAAYYGGGTYGVIASHGGPKPIAYQMDWRYNWTGQPWWFCW